MGKGGERCTCGGTRTQHSSPQGSASIEDVDGGCWCRSCLAKPDEERCRAFEARPDRPEIERNVARVGHRHPSTAVEAAAKVLPKTGSQRREMYDALMRTRGEGMTDDELEYLLARSHQSVSATRNSLMNDGWLTDSGKRRKTRYGNDAIVWVAVPPR